MEIEFRPEDYPNLLSKLNLSYDELEDKIKKMDYIAAPKCNDNNPTEYLIERELRLPFFNKVFYSFINTYRTIPTQKQFIDCYFNANKEWIAYNINEAWLTRGVTQTDFNQALKNRVTRAYPSLIRDIMFGCLLAKKLPKATVIFNEVLDRDGNIDIMIMTEKNNWGIHLFTNTQRANDFRKAKNTRHSITFNNVTEIDYTLDFKRRTGTDKKIVLYDNIDYANLSKLLNLQEYE